MPSQILRGAIAYAAVFAFALAPSLAMARRVTTLAPVTAWNVDWSPTTCTLRRGFSDKAKPDVLMLEQFGPGSNFQLTVISDEFKSYQQGEPLSLRFGGGEPTVVARALPGRVAGGKASIGVSEASLAMAAKKALSMEEDAFLPVTAAMEAAATSIGLDYHARTVLFQTGPLDKAFDAMRKCTDNLVTSWGLDPAQQAKLTAKPQPLTSPANWIKGYAYPQGMVAAGEQALVNFRLSIDAAGVPTTCEVQRSFNKKIFDDLTCGRILERARFSPALDEKGKPTASYYLNRVVWIVG